MPNPPRTLLITAGPTQEPIDDVRFLSNRSSGRLGVELARIAVNRNWTVRLLLGTGATAPTNALADTRVRIDRFRTASDLQRLLETTQPEADVLVMAAAVADFRPASPLPKHKVRRSGTSLTLELEPVPDLLAACAARRSSGQVLIGFALEPLQEMRTSAYQKLVNKGVDAIVANPLETMESENIRAVILCRHVEPGPPAQTRMVELDLGEMGKAEFADRLIRFIEENYP